MSYYNKSDRNYDIQTTMMPIIILALLFLLMLVGYSLQDILVTATDGVIAFVCVLCFMLFTIWQCIELDYDNISSLWNWKGKSLLWLILVILGGWISWIPIVLSYYIAVVFYHLSHTKLGVNND